MSELNLFERKWYGFGPYKHVIDLREQRETQLSNNLFSTEVHTFCNTNIHIGKLDNKLIKFCPLCEVILEKLN